MGGFADDFAAEITGYIMRVIGQASAWVVLAAARLSGRRPDMQKTAAQAAYAAKNPPVNRRLASPAPHGVFFGTRGGQYVVKPEGMDGHVLVVGGTGSGKSSCIAIPTLRNWKGAVFAVDIKGELYENTKQYRPKIKLFSPADAKNVYSYDPFVFLNASPNPAQEARAIAQSIIPLPYDIKEPFWIESAQIILTGAILHFRHEKFSFIDALKRIQSSNPRALIKAVADSSDDKAALCVQSFVDIEGKVLAGIAAEISRGIVTLVTDDDIVAALTCDDGKEVITPADLEEGSDIYIKVPEHLLRQWKSLLTLMINQFITFFERRIEHPDNRPILFLLDEFPRLGKIPSITDALATLRSKKITLCLIVQSLAQLELIYGLESRKVIADTCAFKAILSATDADTQEYFSKLVGTYEKIRRSQSQNFDPYINAPTGSGASYAEDNEKRIIKPEEFAALQEIILLYPLPLNFCRVRKQPYYLTR